MPIPSNAPSYSSRRLLSDLPLSRCPTALSFHRSAASLFHCHAIPLFTIPLALAVIALPSYSRMNCRSIALPQLCPFYLSPTPAHHIPQALPRANTPLSSISSKVDPRVYASSASYPSYFSRLSSTFYIHRLRFIRTYSGRQPQMLSILFFLSISRSVIVYN